MSLELTPTILDFGGRLLEAYERPTQASSEKITELKLDNGEQLLTNIGVAQIPEFIILQAQNIAKGKIKSWSLARVNQTLLLKSLFIDTPSSDKFDFQILNDGVKIFDFFVSRSQTPYEFPAAPLPPSLSIQVEAISRIDFLRIVLQPAVILDTLLPDEDLPS